MVFSQTEVSGFGIFSLWEQRAGPAWCQPNSMAQRI
jgi:hypothetical protein